MSLKRIAQQRQLDQRVQSVVRKRNKFIVAKCGLIVAIKRLVVAEIAQRVKAVNNKK